MMLGPPSLCVIRPDTLNAISRTTSASARKRGPRASSRLRGSRSSRAGDTDRTLLIRRAGDNRLDQVLLAPTVFHEVDRQPIEQFTVLGNGGSRAKVLGCLHQTFAKDRLPDAIDGHARGQRRASVGQPAGKSQASRFAPLCGNGCKAAGVCGCTTCRGWSQFPRSRKWVGRTWLAGRSARCNTDVGSLRIVLPLRVNLVVERLQIRHGRPPGREHRSLLLRTCVARRASASPGWRRSPQAVPRGSVQSSC